MTQAINRTRGSECNNLFSNFIKDRGMDGATFNELLNLARQHRMGHAAVYEFIQVRSSELHRKKEWKPRPGGKPSQRMSEIRYWNKEIWRQNNENPCNN